MIAIVNVSAEDSPLFGTNLYEVRINKQVICSFSHNRQQNGLAQCLRDAAKAVDENENTQIKSIEDIINLINLSVKQ